MLKCSMDRENGYVEMHGTASELIFDVFRVIDQIYHKIKTEDENTASTFLHKLRLCLSEDQYALFSRLAAPDIEIGPISKEVRE